LFNLQGALHGLREPLVISELIDYNAECFVCQELFSKVFNFLKRSALRCFISAGIIIPKTAKNVNHFLRGKISKTPLLFLLFFE